MMQLTNTNKLTMTSREIAELTNKEHRNVLTDIRNMFEKLEIQSAEFSADYIDSRGRTYQEFKLPKDLTLTLISGYDVVLRYKVVKRVEELENRLGPKSFADALQLAADQQREIERQAKAIENLEPYALLGSAVIADAKTFSLTEAFKHLDIDPKVGFQILSQAGWIFKKKQYDSLKDAVWQPCKAKMDAGWLVFKQRPDMYGKYRAQTLVTPVGLKALRSFLEGTFNLEVQP